MKNYKIELITHDYVDGKYQRVEPLMALTTDEGEMWETWETLFEKNNWGAFRDILPFDDSKFVDKVRRDIDKMETEMEEAFNAFYPPVVEQPKNRKMTEQEQILLNKWIKNIDDANLRMGNDG